MHKKQKKYDFSKTEKRGWSVILFGVIGFFGWAATYPIDQGVPGSGFVITQTEKIAVISPSTGLVTQVHKRSGDKVQRGEALVEFDSKPLESNERLTQESIRGLEVSNISLRTALRSRNDQIAALKSQHDSGKKLVEEGFASANSLATIQSQLSLAESEALELKSRVEQNDSKLLELRERITAIKHELRLQKITAPTSGTIMNSSIKSAGVNITTGSPILEIAPDSDVMMIEARIPVDFGSRIHIGMDVGIMFPTLPGSTTLNKKGRLIYLSADRLSDPRTNQTYFEAKVSLDQVSADEAELLKTGLPANVLVNTGPRTLLSYITRPLTERISRGLQ